MSQAATKLGTIIIPAALLAFLVAVVVVHQAGPPSSDSLASLSGLVLLVLTQVPILAALWLAAAGVGWPVRRWLARRAARPMAIQFAAGIAVLLMGAWCLGVFGLLNRASAWGWCGAGWLLLIVQATRPETRKKWNAIPWPNLPWPIVLAAPAAATLLVAATIPPSVMWGVEALGYDVLSYHLQLPREWLEAGRIQGLHHNVYSYLPSLMEAGYTMLGAMQGSVYDAIYTAQLFHASLAVLAAVLIGCTASRHAGRVGGAIAGAVFLAVPWTLITGSMAYNEMAMLSLAAGAVLVTFDSGARDWRGAALAGFLVGAATLAKLPAGPMLALPTGLIFALRLNEVTDVDADSAAARRWRRAIKLAACAALAGAVTLAPYLIRNSVWSGNPVFPFATATFGQAHWSDAEVTRWKNAHGPVGSAGSRVAELGRQWFCNTGYGAIEAAPRLRTGGSDYRNVASFNTEWGFPVLWLAAGFGAVAGLVRAGTRRITLAMLLMLVCQILFWLTTTHLQSRFLIETLLPGSILAGLGANAFFDSKKPGIRAIGGLLGSALVAALTLVSGGVFWSQTPRFDGPLPPWAITDSLAPSSQLSDLKLDDARIGDHAINHFPEHGLTLMVADVSRLLYIRRPIVYHSAFDPDPLGKIIRDTGGDPAVVTEALKRLGITHVWIHWSEVNRLYTTYGTDRDVTPTKLAELAKRWRVVFRQPEQNPVAMLFELP